MDRREFSALLPALCLLLNEADGQSAERTEPYTKGTPTRGPVGGPLSGPLRPVENGVYTPGPAYGTPPQRYSNRLLAGVMQVGSMQLDIHESRQEAGTPQEAVIVHPHNKIWLMREGVAELMTAGVVRTMRAGDIGFCKGGDPHWMRNIGHGPCAYFVVTIGPVQG